MADFFEKAEDKAEEVVEEVAEDAEAEELKIKVGEEEYSQDELNRLVDLGKIGVEAEEKHNTKIDKIWPDFTKDRQELIGLREEKAKWGEQQEAKVEAKAEAGEQLSPEEQKKVVINQAKELGIVTKEDFNALWAQQRAGERLLDSCKSLEKDLDGKDGKPAFKTEDILSHMQETGIRNPQDAYDLKFKPELAKWRDDKLAGAKPDGMVSESSSSAGGKEPPKVKVTKENFEEAVRESLYGKS